VVLALYGASGVYLARSLSKLTPLAAMRTPESGPNRSGLKLSSWLGSAGPTPWIRLALRNAIRGGATTWLTVVCMGLGFGATNGLLIAFTSTEDTVLDNISAQNWDVQVDFSTPQSSEQIQELLRKVDSPDYLGYVKGAAMLHVDDAKADKNQQNEETLYITGYDPDQAWDVSEITRGRQVHSDEDAILMDSSSMTRHSLTPDSKVQLNSTTGTHETQIVGDFPAMMPGDAKTDEAYARTLLGIPQGYTGAFIRGSSWDVDKIVSTLSDSDQVSKAMTKQQVSTEMMKLSVQITSILKLAAGIGAGVAVLFILACMSHTVQKRRGDYQLLRQLGFQDRTLRLTIQTETLLLGICAAILALPIGAGVGWFICRTVSGAWFRINPHSDIKDFLIVIVPALAAMPLICLPMARSVLREPLDVFIRSRETG
jgi:hypothetical protein